MRLALFGSCLVVAACYSPRYEPCRVSCGPAGCPHGTTCGADGFCHGPGEEACPGAADASVEPVDAGSDGDVNLPVDGAGMADASCRVPLLLNGDFELVTQSIPRDASSWFVDFASGDLFVIATGEGSPAFTADQGMYGVRAGGDNVDGILYQFVGALPANAIAVELRARYRMVGTETEAGRDLVRFTLEDLGATSIIALGGTLDGVDAPVTQWTSLQTRVSVTPSATEYYFFVDFATGTMKPTTFELDQLALDAIICE